MDLEIEQLISGSEVLKVSVARLCNKRDFSPRRRHVWFCVAIDVKRVTWPSIMTNQHVADHSSSFSWDFNFNLSHFFYLKFVSDRSIEDDFVITRHFDVIKVRSNLNSTPIRCIFPMIHFFIPLRTYTRDHFKQVGPKPTRDAFAPLVDLRTKHHKKTF